MKYLFLFVLIAASFSVMARHYTDEEIDNMSETEYKNYLMNMSSDDDENEEAISPKDQHILNKMEATLID